MITIPLFLDSVRAGFPSAAEDFIDTNIDLNDYLIKNPSSTFMVRVSGNSMKDLGIISGDILVVDKSLEVNEGNIVIASVNQEFTVKRIKKIRDSLYLVPANNDFKAIKIENDDDFQIWGIVVHCIHSFR
jgi:DNA polymerase V